MASRNIFIGDVHWCIEELEALIQEVWFNKKRDRLFFTGDVIGKGPESMEVLRFIESLKDRATSVMWNHEHGFCKNLKHLASKSDKAPIDEKIRKFARQLKKTWRIDFLRELPYIVRHKTFTLVHQWLIPWVKPSKHKQEITDDWRKIPNDWYKYYNWKREVIYGHWSKYWLQKRWNTTGLDTACVDGWYLTAYIPKTWDIVQQKCMRERWY